ncbi:44626_t:CDS:2 [Gigaspora margarita]|uniref:44626_t:CDS:1 n=1 Tax=Gigaspora margarita TaxID=4874 RepID=A0ABN7WAU1_GIGMA|nr:44626_t:CDS:2 [Gigaspora margarita]
MVDIALNIADEYIFDSIYARFYPISIPDNTTTITNLQYSLPQLMKHPKFLKNQIRKEITLSATGFPITSLVTIPWFLGEVRGYSKLYDDINDYGFLYGIFSIILFLFFTDMCIYWIHRWLHHPLIYKNLHKPHHRWISEYLSSGTFINGEEQFDRKKKRDQKVWVKQSMEVDKFDENGKEKEE